MTTRVNNRYFAELGRSDAVRGIVVDAAEAIAARARSTAPVDTGAYRASIHVEVDETPYRVVARVVADADDSMIVESQTGNLARAVGGSARA